MKLINMKWLEVIKYRRTEIRFSPDIYMYYSLKMRWFRIRNSYGVCI